MSPSNQNPDPAAFFGLVEDIPELSVWEASFDAAEDFLTETRPEGFQVEDIGRHAWDRLPERDRPAALNALFYTYWSAMVSDREELARFERDNDMRVLLRGRLDEYEDLAAVSIPAPAALVADIAALARQLVGGAA
ncbi:MAG TPA: hypothetical protein VK698_39645 [Kofleriaceae bacterium]|nr:hypothetical protein [Kofleriaceae bacterium]